MILSILGRQLSSLRCVANIQVKKHAIIANSFSQLHQVYTHPVTSLVKYYPVGFNCRYNSYEKSYLNLDVPPWDNMDDDSRGLLQVFRYDRYNIIGVILFWGYVMIFKLIFFFFSQSMETRVAWMPEVLTLMLVSYIFMIIKKYFYTLLLLHRENRFETLNVFT